MHAGGTHVGLAAIRRLDRDEAVAVDGDVQLVAGFLRLPWLKSVPGRSLMANTRAGKLSPNTCIERACSKSRRKPLVEMFARLLA